MLLSLAMIVAAQQQPGVSAAPAPCELHVYGIRTDGPSSFKSNAFIKVAPPSDDPIAFVNVQSPQRRLADLSDDDLKTALSLDSNVKVSRHWDVTVDRSARKSVQPLLPSTSPCHYELIGYSGTAFPYKRSRSGNDEVFVNLIYREFSESRIVQFKVDSGGSASMRPLAKTAETSRETALADLHQGSRDIINSFGKQVAKRRANATDN